MRTLVVAAGGGGDAITAAALVGPLDLTGPPVVMTYSWDRLLIDPVPGSRTIRDFTGLRMLGPNLAEVLPTTTPKPPAGSSLPRLARELPARLLLLDPSGGTHGLAEQITAAAALIDAEEIALVDVGGDALTTGTDPGLRSPLADQLALAACVRTGIPTRLIIAGPALDGELPAAVVEKRLVELGAATLPDLDPADVGPVRHVFRWHPSEASGLLAAAAAGHRGWVEVRDAGDQVELTDTTTGLASVDAKRAASATPAAHLDGCRTLVEADHIVRELTGISEIDYETRKAARRDAHAPHHPSADDLDAIDHHSEEAAARSADYISLRRLAELIGATTLDAFEELSALLASARPTHYEPSLYRTRAPSS